MKIISNFLSNQQNAIIQTESGTKYKKADLKTNLYASGGGLISAIAISKALDPIRILQQIYTLENMDTEPNYWENKVLKAHRKYHIALERHVLRITNGKYKTLEFENAKNFDVDTLPAPKKRNIEKLFPFLYKYRTYIGKEKMRTCVNAQNACYNVAKNKILIHFDKFAIAAYHEMGHSIVSRFTKIGKFLAKTRNKEKYVFRAMLGLALLKRPKAKDEKPSGFLDKTTAALKKYAPLICFISTIPKFTDEFLADKYGVKLAKGILTKYEMKALKKSNWLAFSSYILSSLLSPIQIYAASKIKDKLSTPQEIKQNQIFSNLPTCYKSLSHP